MNMGMLLEHNSEWSWSIGTSYTCMFAHVTHIKVLINVKSSKFNVFYKEM